MFGKKKIIVFATSKVIYPNNYMFVNRINWNVFSPPPFKPITKYWLTFHPSYPILLTALSRQHIYLQTLGPQWNQINTFYLYSRLHSQIKLPYFLYLPLRKSCDLHLQLTEEEDIHQSQLYSKINWINSFKNGEINVILLIIKAWTTRTISFI